MDPASTVLTFLALMVLIGINAFFVAAQFALVSARRSRIEPLARAGDRRARHVLAAMDSPEPVIAATQMGITFATIAIGWIAHAYLYSVIHPQLELLNVTIGGSAAPASRVAAVVIALIAVVYLHVVVGEQVPRIVAAHDPERVAQHTVRSAKMFGAMLYPLIRIATVSSMGLVRLFGGQPTALPSMDDTRDEIRQLVEQSHQEGARESEQEQMLLGVIQFRDTLAREVMTPRRDIIALPVTATHAETLALATEEGHSRIPIYGESIDDVIGILLVKDLLSLVTRDGAGFDLSVLMREPYFVPDTKRIGELLAELRTRSVHMAIVLDEFGGTDGLVTLEDMLEEIVGDIYDEHDIPEEETDFEITESGDVLIDGSASIFDVNERFGLSLPEEDYDTVGGYIFGELGRVPVAGDAIAIDTQHELHVHEVEERRVTRVRLMTPSRNGLPDTGTDASR